LEGVLGGKILLITDELPFNVAGAKHVPDLLLVRVCSGLAELYHAELKSDRKMKEVFGQVLDFRPHLENPQLPYHWRTLAELLTGHKFKWANRRGNVAGLVVWPYANPGTSTAAQRRDQHPRIDVVGYEQHEQQFTFRLEWEKICD
jgi:hypothetical protein